MNKELPLYGQEKDDTCALACLRMVLAAHGTDIEERVLETEARREDGGTHIEELERVARRFGLVAQIQRATAAQLRVLLAKRKLPIAYVNRVFFDVPSLKRVRSAFTHPKLHAVIPTRLSLHYITFHYPLKPARIARRSLARFDRAHRFLNYATLVCDPPGH